MSAGTEIMACSVLGRKDGRKEKKRRKEDFILHEKYFNNYLNEISEI